MAHGLHYGLPGVHLPDALDPLLEFLDQALVLAVRHRALRLAPRQVDEDLVSKAVRVCPGPLPVQAGQAHLGLGPLP